MHEVIVGATVVLTITPTGASYIHPAVITVARRRKIVLFVHWDGKYHLCYITVTKVKDQHAIK